MPHLVVSHAKDGLLVKIAPRLVAFVSSGSGEHEMAQSSVGLRSSASSYPRQSEMALILNDARGRRTTFCGSADRDRRILAVTQLRDWCMAQLSELTLDGREGDARALTAEHLELLEQADAMRILWMIVEPDPA